MKRYQVVLTNGSEEGVTAASFVVWPEGVCFLGWKRGFEGVLEGTVEDSDIVIFYPAQRIHRVELIGELEA